MTRRGIATIWAIVVLAVVTLMTAAITGQMIAARRSLEASLNRTQTVLLVEAAELHAQAMLKASKDYTGETKMLLKNGRVIIAVTPDAKPGVYRVVIEARYPVDHPRVAATRKETVITQPAAPARVRDREEPADPR